MARVNAYKTKHFSLVFWPDLIGNYYKFKTMTLHDHSKWLTVASNTYSYSATYIKKQFFVLTRPFLDAD